YPHSGVQAQVQWDAQLNPLLLHQLKVESFPIPMDSIILKLAYVEAFIDSIITRMQTTPLNITEYLKSDEARDLWKKVDLKIEHSNASFRQGQLTDNLAKAIARVIRTGKYGQLLRYIIIENA